MKTPILGSAYVARSLNVADNRMVNLFPEVVSEGGKEPAFLNRAPGLRFFGTVGDGPVRGMRALGDYLYVVSGKALYKVGKTPTIVATEATPGSWTNGPDDCGIASVTGITASGTITLTVTGSDGCSPDTPALDGTYTTLAAPPAEYGATEGASIAGNGTKILSVGGRNDAGSSYHSHAALYDIATDTWTNVTSVPVSVYSGFGSENYTFKLLSITEDKFLLIIGYTGAVYEYSVSANTWTPKTSLAAADTRIRFDAVFDGNDTVYVFGGLHDSGYAWTTEGTRVLLSYSVSGDTWTRGPVGDDSYVRQMMGVAYNNGKLYIAHGLIPSAGLAPFQTRDTTTETWVDLDPLASVGAVSAHSASTGEGVYSITTSDSSGFGSDNYLTRLPLGGGVPYVVANLTTALSRSRLPSICRAGSCDIFVMGSSGVFLQFASAGSSSGGEPTYQFSVGTETWPASPAPWSDIAAGSPHAFVKATLTFDPAAPTTTPGTYTNSLTGPVAGIAPVYGTFLGTVDGTGPVSMADNGKQVCIAANGPAYLYDTDTSTFNRITDPDLTGAGMVDYIDGFFVFNEPDSQIIVCSALNNGSDIPGEFEGAVGSPDNIVGLIVDHREVWVFGTNSVEVWYNAGLAGFPLERIQGAFNEIGCAAAHSIAKLDNAVFWLGNDARGKGIVYRSNGYSGERISTHGVEWQIQQYGDLSGATAYTYQQDGHSFYVLNFPDADTTWVYDVATGAWHERAGFENGAFTRHRGNCHAFFNGENLVGDYRTGDLYALDLNVFADNGALQKWLRSWRALPPGQNDLKRTTHHSLQLDCETGIGLSSGQGSDPQILLRWSDDGCHTWSNEHWATMGAIGRYAQRVIWRRLGMTTKLRDRVYEVSGTDPVKLAILGAELVMGATNA